MYSEITPATRGLIGNVSSINKKLRSCTELIGFENQVYPAVQEVKAWQESGIPELLQFECYHRLNTGIDIHPDPAANIISPRESVCKHRIMGRHRTVDVCQCETSHESSNVPEFPVDSAEAPASASLDSLIESIPPRASCFRMSVLQKSSRLGERPSSNGNHGDRRYSASTMMPPCESHPV